MARMSTYWLWLVLALPGLRIASELASSTDPRIYHDLLHPTGEFSARFLIFAMLTSPLALVFKGWRGPLWLKKNRRYFGVAAFAYALAHTVFYLIDKGTLAATVSELPRLYIWSGWIAFAIFIPLAGTSMDYFVRMMGPLWKQIQRATYGAAALTLLHWSALHDWGGLAPAFVHFGPLLIFESYRIWYWYFRARNKVEVEHIV